MIGEQLTATEITESGLLGDRAYALRDTSDGKIASAKNPRTRPNLFDYGAALTSAATAGEKLPPARITLPDGNTINTERPDAARILSAAHKREVRLEKIERNWRDAAASNKETSEEYWLDMKGLEHRETVTDFNLPKGTFFDTATIHVLTTATLQRLHELISRGPFRGPKVPPKHCSEVDRRF